MPLAWGPTGIPDQREEGRSFPVCRSAGTSPAGGEVRGRAAAGAARGEPALQPSLAELTPACSAAKPPRARSRADSCQHMAESCALVAAPAGSFPGCASLLSWLPQQPSPPEGPPGQAQPVTWPSTVFHLPRLAIFPISSIREAPFIKSSTGAHQHTREKGWKDAQPLILAASHRLRFGV